MKPQEKKEDIVVQNQKEEVVVEEGLVYVQSKRERYAQEAKTFKAGKKPKNRRKKKNQKVQVYDENSKLDIDPYTLAEFDTLDLRPPLFVKEIDAFCGKLSDKKTEYLNQRKELVDKAAKGELKFSPEKEGEDFDEEKPKNSKRKNNKAKKQVMNQEEFPDL